VRQPDGRSVADGQGRWRVLALVSLAVVLSMTPWFSATAILPELRVEWGLSEGQAAWMTNAVQLGFVVGALLSSILNIPDIVSLRHLMGAAALVASAANLCLLSAGGPESAIAARFVTGLALAGVYPPALKLVATWFVRGRGIAMGALIGALTLGSAFPHLARGLVGAFDWRAVITAVSLSSLLGAAMLLACAREGPAPFGRAVFDPRQIGRVVRSRAAVLANLGYFGHMWELYAMWGWFLAYSRASTLARGGEPGPENSILTFAVVASGVLGCLLGGVLSDRIGRTAAAGGMMAVSGTCAALMGFTFAGPMWLFALVAVVWGVSVVGDSAQFSAMVTEVSDTKLVGTALALQLGIGFALTIVSLRLTPWLAETVGWRWSFLVLVPGPIVGVAAMLALRRLPEAIRLAGGLR
jgi:MFS family permease